LITDAAVSTAMEEQQNDPAPYFAQLIDSPAHRVEQEVRKLQPTLVALTL
jgi:hypothetical protein